MIDIILAILATYGITTLLVEYDGAYNILYLLRQKVPAFRCVACSTVWIGIPVAFLSGVGVLGYLAIIGGVILLDRSFNS